MAEIVLKSVEVSNAVQTICDRPGASVRELMDTLKISYEEWSYLSFAALPAIRYRGEARFNRHMLEDLITKIQVVIRQIREEKSLTDAGRIASALNRVVNECRLKILRAESEREDQ